MGQSHTAYEDCEWGRTQIPRPNSLFVLPCMLIIKLTSASESLWSLQWWPWSCCVPHCPYCGDSCVWAEWGVGSSWGPVSWWKGLERTVLPLPGPSLWPPRKETAEEAKWLDSTSETWKCEGITLSFRLPSLLAACKIAMLIPPPRKPFPTPQWGPRFHITASLWPWHHIWHLQEPFSVTVLVHLPVLYIHFLHFKCINSFKCFYSLNAYLLLPISDQHRNNRTIKFKQIKGKSHALLPFLFPFYLSLLWFPVQFPISGRHTFSIYWFVRPPETQMRSK